MKLAEMAMSDPLYMQCWGPNAEEVSHDESRRAQFLNLMVSFWYMQWELGDVSNEGLMAMATSGLFHTDAGRRLDNREAWTANSVGSHLNKFRSVMDRALSSTLAAHLADGPSTPSEQKKPDAGAQEAVTGAIAVATSAAAAYLVVRSVWRRGRLR